MSEWTAFGGPSSTLQQPPAERDRRKGRHTHTQSDSEGKAKAKSSANEEGPCSLCHMTAGFKQAGSPLLDFTEGADMASKPAMKQDKQAAKLQDPIKLEGKCATGTRTARGKGGDRAKKVRRWGWSSHTHNTTHTSDCSRTLSHTPHLYSTCLTVLRPRWAQHHARAHRSARGSKDRGGRSATSAHASSE